MFITLLFRTVVFTDKGTAIRSRIASSVMQVTVTKSLHIKTKMSYTVKDLVSSPFKTESTKSETTEFPNQYRLLTDAVRIVT